MPVYTYFNMNVRVKLRDLKASLPEPFSLNKAGSGVEYREYFDTFSKDLYKKSIVFYISKTETDKDGSSEEQHLNVAGTDSEEVLACQGWPAYDAAPVYLSDITDADLKQHLEKPLDIRALQSFFTVSISIEYYDILNDNEKIINRMQLLKPRLHKGKATRILPHRISLEPVKGYQKEHERLVKWLKNQGGSQAGSYLPDAVDKLRLRTTYTDKVSPELNPLMSTQKAFRIILSELLEIIRVNEQGIINDIDTEFLHDFRVSVRKIRTLAGEFPYVFDDHIYEEARNEFKYIGQQSNILRDRDVYLLEQNWYMRKVMPALRPGLAAFFRYIEHERKEAHSQFTDFLESSEYRSLIKKWQKFSAAPSKVSGKKLGEFASDLLYRRFRKIVKRGRTIDHDTPDEKLHRLRIQGKKFRYFLEFFKSLYPEKKLKNLIVQMKTFQDSLGVFNDRSVQIQNISEFLEQHPDITTQTREALENLLEFVTAEQKRERENFEKIFDQFSHSGTVKLAEDLFVTRRGDS